MNSAELVLAGEKKLQGGDWAGAQADFEAALQEHDSPDAHDGLGIALWWLNKVDAAHEHRTTAYVGFKKQGNVRRAAFIAAWLAREQVFLDANQSAMKGWFARAERLLSEDDSCPERGWLDIFRASMLAAPQELAQTAQETIRVARRFQDADLETFARAFEAAAQVALGNVDPGMALLDEAMTAATSGELSSYMTISEIFCVTLSTCELAGDWVRTEHWCQVATDFAQRHQCPFLSAYCRTTYGSLLTATGRWQAAESTLTEAIHAFEAGHRALRVHAVLKLADLRISQGRLEEAEIMLTGYEDYGEALIPLARLHLAQGEAGLARALLEHSLQNTPTPTLHHTAALLILVEAELALGDVDSARRTVQQLTVLAEQTGSDFLRAQTDLTSGRLKRMSGESDAVQAFQSAWERLHAYEQSLLAGRVRLEMAEAVKDNDWAGAVTWAKAALATFTRLGAARDTDAARKMLRDLGVGQTAPRGHEPLTQRETQILGLIAHGLTNRDIAERLFLSAKTVEHHVSQILSKLGVKSRTEAAAFAASQHLNDTANGSP